MAANPPSAPADFIARVRSKLVEAVAPSVLEIRDDTARHAGHREAAGRFHLSILVVSQSFVGLSPLARHRLVSDTLATELAGPLHALSVNARTPDEALSRPAFVRRSGS